MTATAAAIANPDTAGGAETAPEAGVAFAPHVLRDYALLADGYRGALVGSARRDPVAVRAALGLAGRSVAESIGGRACTR